MKVLVPTDFSKTSESGLRYAISFVSNYGKGEILVFHAIDDEQHLISAEKKLKSFCDVEVPLDIEMTSMVSIGQYDEEIGIQASKNDCSLIIMATKGAKGLQKLLGSNAMRVVGESNIPHIITQKEVYDDELLDNIAVPITLEREDKKILSTVAAIAGPLNASVIFMYKDKKDEFLSATISRNLNFAKSFLRNRGIKTVSIELDMKLDFAEAIIKNASLHQCDLIATVNHHNDGILNLFGANFDQNILENNAHIPVLTVDARNHEHVTDIFMTTK